MKPLITILLLSCVFQMTAQVKIRNLSLSKPDTNLLYYGIENKISIEGISKDSYSISLSNAHIDTSSGLYILRPKSADSIVKFEIHILKGKTISKSFKIKKIPDLSYMVAGTTSIVISKETLLQFPKVELVLPGSYYILPDYRIYSMDVAIARKNEDLFPVSMYGSSGYFSVQLISEIKRMHSGDKIYLENIKCGCPDCRVRTLTGRVITISD